MVDVMPAVDHRQAFDKDSHGEGTTCFNKRGDGIDRERRPMIPFAWPEIKGL